MYRLLKALFPFRAKHTYLRAYWWHRFFVVVFFVLVGAIPFLVLAYSDAGYWDCLSHHTVESCDIESILKNVGALPFALFLWLFTESKFVFPISHILGSLVTALVGSYTFQIIYYKALIYIIFGNRKEKTS